MQSSIAGKLFRPIIFFSPAIGKKPKFAKVFGERNTGTNFLRLLIAKNTPLKLLGDGGRSRSKGRLRLLRSAYSHLSDDALKVISERLLDEDRKDFFPSHLGWKHGCPDSKRLQTSSIFGNSIFVCIIRNPWSFAISLHKRPYNINPRGLVSLHDFVSSPILANERDNIPDIFLDSPVRLWNFKVASYLKLKQELPCKTFIAFYEDIVLNPFRFIENLCSFAKCKAPNKITIPQISTKAHLGEARSYENYKREVLEFDPIKVLGLATFQTINSYLDKDLVQQTPFINLFTAPYKP